MACADSSTSRWPFLRRGLSSWPRRSRRGVTRWRPWGGIGMDHWIEEVGHPERLLLAWQAPDDLRDRVRWAVGELTAEGNSGQFRYYADDESSDSTQGARRCAHGCGVPGLPCIQCAEVERADYLRDGVIDAFMRRLPPPTRSDFPRYLEHFRLRSATGTQPAVAAGGHRSAPAQRRVLADRSLGCRRRGRDVVFEIAGHRHNTECRDLFALPIAQLVPAAGERPRRRRRSALRRRKTDRPCQPPRKTDVWPVVERVSPLPHGRLRLNGTPVRPAPSLSVRVASRCRAAGQPDGATHGLSGGSTNPAARTELRSNVDDAAGLALEMHPKDRVVEDRQPDKRPGQPRSQARRLRKRRTKVTNHPRPRVSAQVHRRFSRHYGQAGVAANVGSTSPVVLACSLGCRRSRCFAFAPGMRKLPARSRNPTFRNDFAASYPEGRRRPKRGSAPPADWRWRYRDRHRPGARE